jgi:hypothetical protein
VNDDRVKGDSQALAWDFLYVSNARIREVHTPIRIQFFWIDVDNLPAIDLYSLKVPEEFYAPYFELA